MSIPVSGSGASGAGSTATSNRCRALVFDPPTSVAVTVMVADPAVSGVTVTRPPATPVATAGPDETAR